MNPDLQPTSITSANPAIGAHGDIYFYLPEGNGPFPFVLAIHGGSWRNGHQNSFCTLAPKLIACGIALVTISYRRVPDFGFPEIYDDCLFALKWLKEQGAKHCLNTGRCVLLGSSAGGHLAMLLAARTTAEDLPRPQLCGVAQFCGPMDLVAQREWDKVRDSILTYTFLRSEPDENPALYRVASPIHHFHPNMPPVWMAHGTGDVTVPVSQARAAVVCLRTMDHDLIYLEARDVRHTWKDVGIDGRIVEPSEALFERDLMRFLHRILLGPFAPQNPSSA